MITEEAAVDYGRQLEHKLFELRTMMQIVSMVCTDGSTDDNEMDRVETIVRIMEPLVEDVFDTYHKTLLPAEEDLQ